MAETRAVRRIRRAVEDYAGTVMISAIYERPTPVEMQGLTGGWWIECADGRLFNGLSADGVVDEIKAGRADDPTDPHAL